MRDYEYQIYVFEDGTVLKEGVIQSDSREHAINSVRATAMGEGIDFLAKDIRIRLLSLDEMDQKLTIESVLRKHGITQTQLSKRFGIPYKTIQNWKTLGANRRACPDYVLRMIDKILTLEKG